MVEELKNKIKKLREEMNEDLDQYEFEENEERIVAEESIDPPTVRRETTGQILAFMSGKGGAGKTGIAVNVANYCAINNKKVLLVDCDMNTNGATAFFRTGRAELFDNPTKILTMNKIVLAFNDDMKAVDIESLSNLELLCINTENENFYFLPANVDDGNFEEQTVGKDLLQKIEEHYFSKWRTIYDIIILDFSAGGARITECLSDLPDKICIVMNPDGICRRIVRTRLQFVFRNCNLNNIICCVNKRNWYKRSVNVGALFNEFPGFINSGKYKTRYEAGKMIEPANLILWRELSRIVNKVYRERIFR